MNIEMSAQEVEFLRMLLTKELEETRVEMHHAKNIEFKGHLQAREQHVQSLVDRLDVHIVF